MTTRTLRVQVQAKFGSTRLKQIPDLLEELNITNDSAVIHVPFVANRVHSLNVVNHSHDAAAKIKWAQGISLLNTSSRLNDVFMSGGLSIAPFRPT